MKIEVDKVAAREFAFFWAKEATTKIWKWPQGREAWLWAYNRYDWTQADPEVAKQLEDLAIMFHKLNGGR